MRSLALAAALLLAGCATAPAEPSGPPSLGIAAGAPAPAQARLYSACIAQAHANGVVDRVENTLRFSCSGAEAQAFFDGLAAYSAAERSEYSAGARTWRFTQALVHDTSGVDYCWREEAEYSCTIVLNVGEFIDQ